MLSPKAAVVDPQALGRGLEPTTLVGTILLAVFDLSTAAGAAGPFAPPCEEDGIAITTLFLKLVSGAGAIVRGFSSRLLQTDSGGNAGAEGPFVDGAAGRLV